MENILDSLIIYTVLILSIFAILVWLVMVLAILRSPQDQDRFRTNPWLTSFAFIWSPAILLLHICAYLLRKFWLLVQIMLLCILVLLAIVISPAFLLAIPFGFLVFRLVKVAAPIGSKILNLSMDFFADLDFWFGGRKQERLS